MLKRALWVLPILLLSVGTAAEATPIVANAGDTLTFNFDFAASGAVPAPPYNQVVFDTGLVPSTFTPGSDIGQWTLFSDWNGTGSAIPLSLGAALGGSNTFDPGVTDGVFSAVLTLTSGSITIDPYALGFTVSGLSTGPIAPLAPTAVPEPASMLLLGTGLLGAAWRRCRQ